MPSKEISVTPNIEDTPNVSIRALKKVEELLGENLTTPMEEVRIVRRGLKTSAIEAFKTLSTSKTELEWIINSRTLLRRKRNKERLNPVETERLLKAAKIHSLANEVFGSRDKGLNWMNRKLKQFDDLSPVELIQSEAGAAIVENKLLQIDCGFVA